MKLHKFGSYLISNIFFFPELNEGKITVGKIYAGLQILECWRVTKFKKTDDCNPPVNIRTYFIFLFQR